MPSRVAFMLRAFSYPNYRLFFGGQIVSLIGSWISMTATSWLVYRLTGSAMALGSGRIRRADSRASSWDRSPARISIDGIAIACSS